MTLAKKAFSFLKNSFNLTKKLTLNLSDNPSDFSISHKIARFKQENEGQICNFFLLYFKKSGKYWNKLTRSSGWLFEWSCQRRTFIRHFCSVTAQFKLSNSNRPNHVHKSQNYNFPKNPLKKSGKKGFVLNFYSVARTFFVKRPLGGVNRTLVKIPNSVKKSSNSWARDTAQLFCHAHKNTGCWKSKRALFHTETPWLRFRFKFKSKQIINF